MLYLILGILILVSLIVNLGQWLAKREADKNVEFLVSENIDIRIDSQERGLRAFEAILQAEEERDNAIANLAIVLKADPAPFNKVAVELGLHGVVYRFHSLEDTKEITA